MVVASFDGLEGVPEAVDELAAVVRALAVLREVFIESELLVEPMEPAPALLLGAKERGVCVAQHIPVGKPVLGFQHGNAGNAQAAKGVEADEAHTVRGLLGKRGFYAAAERALMKRMHHPAHKYCLVRLSTSPGIVAAAAGLYQRGRHLRKRAGAQTFQGTARKHCHDCKKYQDADAR